MRYETALADAGLTLRPSPLFARGEDERYATGSTASRARAVLGAEVRLRRRLSRQPDGGIAWLQRQASMSPTLDAERRLLDGRRFVLDLDDAAWIDGRLAGGHRLAALKGSGRKLRWLAERADAVLVGNDYLAEQTSRWSSRVIVVPSVVDHAAAPIRRHEQAGDLVLGWIGSRTTARYLADVLPALEQAAHALAPRRVRLLVVGGTVEHHGRLDVEHRPWSEQAELAALMELDAGLMPLPDDAWTRGKCAYKGIQYMASGVPVVASDVGVSGTVISGNGAGLAVRDAAGWVQAVTELAGDVDLRRRMGAAGRRAVERDYSLERWAPTVTQALRGD